MEKGKLQRIEQLCRLSVEAGITKLCEIRTWPRPAAARRLRIGYDFSWEDLRSIPQVNELIDYLACDNKIQSIYFSSSSASEPHILYEYWSQLLLRILRETEGISPSNRVFRKWFSRFLKELYSDTAIWRVVYTITGLTLKEAKLKFDNATVLTSIPAYRWLDIIWREQQYDARFDWEAIGLDKASIITTVRISKPDYAGTITPPPHLTQHIERHLSVIDAIRLTKSGVPRLHCYAVFQLSDFPVSDPLAYYDREGGHRLYENETVLERSDFKAIKAVWHERLDARGESIMQSHIKSNAMGTAYGRFLGSYDYKNWLDAIVDLTIALESLFDPKPNQELGHRISLRAAWLLGADRQADGETSYVKKTVYNLVRTMYAIRSSRVHGKALKREKIRKWVQTLSGVEYDDSKEIQLLELAMESARYIVRKAIAACARLSKLEGEGPKWPFPEKFDENIVIDGKRKIWQKAAGIKR